MRSPRHASLALIAAIAAAGASCGDKVQTGLTGIDVHVSFGGDLDVYKLRFSGWLGSVVAFAQEDRPDDRTPSPDGENLVILLPESMGGSDVFIQVDGIDRGGAPLGSSGAVVAVASREIRVLELRLGQPRICGDSEVHPDAELCDDGNSQGSDGCSSQCVIETDWLCNGTPSVCRRCGDGVCTQGEDLCSCPQDCAGALCGDGACCEEAGEGCSCPEDCGAPECGDDVCCDSESSCQADCGDCGNGTCEGDRGEDACRCPEDCQAGDGECGNGSCCDQDEEDAVNCPADCCQDPVCGDSACCPTENATECAEDCCETPQCGDGVCCPNEDASECAADCCEEEPMCGDGVCCPGSENADSCAEDCCGQDPPCGDGRCCPGEQCESDGCEQCPTCSPNDCTPCCETCGEDLCIYECANGCECRYDCTGSSTSQCDVTCPESTCRVECGELTSCVVNCSGLGLFDASPGSMPDCMCRSRGGDCLLTCPPGIDAVACPDGMSVACALSSCP
jgi:hypothetical protein